MIYLGRFLSVWLLFVLLMTSCEDEEDVDDIKEDEEDVTEGNAIPLEDLSKGEGSYFLTGDVEISGTGEANHDYYAAESGDRTWSLHRVEVQDTDNGVDMIVEFHILDPDADANDGKVPESGSYNLYEPGLSEPTDDFAKVIVKGEGLESYFTTDKESTLELTVTAENVWEGEFTNVADDYQTDEVVTVHGSFKATPSE